MQRTPKSKTAEKFNDLHLLAAVLLIWSSGDVLAASVDSLLITKYSLHIIKLLNLGILLVMLLRKSIGHQRRLNWFFGAVSVVLISTQTLVFERFFGKADSLLSNGVSSIVLICYFIIYWIMTWNTETPSQK